MSQLCPFLDADLKTWSVWYHCRNKDYSMGWANKSILADWGMPKCGGVFDTADGSIDRWRAAEATHKTINSVLSLIEQTVLMHYYLTGQHSMRYVARQMRIHHATVKKMMLTAFNKIKLANESNMEVAA